MIGLAVGSLNDGMVFRGPFESAALALAFGAAEYPNDGSHTFTIETPEGVEAIEGGAHTCDLVISGNLGMGLSFYGPFPQGGAADDWAEDPENNDIDRDDGWWMTSMVYPYRATTR